MPLKLRAVVGAAGLTHKQFGQLLRQQNGKTFSETTVSLLLGRDIWPIKTPRAWLEKQIRDVLRGMGNPEADTPDLFTVQEDEVATTGPTVSAIHTNGGTLKRERATIPADLFEYEERQMLTPAARKHFRLFRDPFNADPESTEDVFYGPDQRYASESVMEAIRNGRLFALVGESGSGKSTILDDIKDRIRRESLQVRMIQPMLPDKSRLTAIGILEAIVRDLDPTIVPKRRSEQLTRQAIDLLSESALAGQLNVILFEEAHDLSVHALKQLKRFHEFKSGWKRLMSIVLVGQPEILSKLGEHAQGDAREVARRLEIAQLLPLDEQLEAYVSHKLARANRDAAEVFATDTWDAVRQRLQGTIRRPGAQQSSVSMLYPLLVNNLLVKALNTAAEMGAQRVDAAIVKGC